MNDPFFNKRKCDRCGGELHIRTMSWFTEECICSECHDKEAQLKRKLREQGVDTNKLEGCGYIPKVK